MIIRRGFIYLAALDPVIGHEIAKTRPVAVISNDKNRVSAAKLWLVWLPDIKQTGEIKILIAALAM
jgi:hypothetical protein